MGFFELLAVAIGAAELGRALKGWENPGDVYGSGASLKDDYFPGDIGFDPLGLKPKIQKNLLLCQQKSFNMVVLPCLLSPVLLRKNLPMEKKFLLSWVWHLIPSIHLHYQFNFNKC